MIIYITTFVYQVALAKSSWVQILMFSHKWLCLKNTYSLTISGCVQIVLVILARSSYVQIILVIYSKVVGSK